MSFLEGLTEQVGELAAPIAPALDFLGMGPETLGTRTDPASLFAALGQGVKDAALASPAGLLAGGASIAQQFGQMSARDRLIYGGLLVAGGVAGGRALHARFRARAPKVMMAPAGIDELARMGASTPFHELAPRAIELQRVRPGLRGRTLNVLAAETEEAAAGSLARFKPRSPTAGIIDPRIAEMSRVVSRYGQVHPSGPDGARVDWAKFDRGSELDLFKYEHNAKPRKLYAKFTSGEHLTDAEADELGGYVKSLGDATDELDEDLSLGLTGRVTQVDFADGGAYVHFRHVVPDFGDVWVDEKARAHALRALNPRAYAEQGYKNFRQLWDTAMEDSDLRAIGRPGKLPKPLGLGKDWYPTARSDVARAFGLSDEHTPELARVVALTSLTSEAELWAGNVAKAQRAWAQVADNPAYATDDFQNWLRAGTSPDARRPGLRRTYDGPAADRNQKLFDDLFRDFRNSGLYGTTETVKKVARLISESPEEVFASTVGTKQKNFYLNILHPDADYPVTVDRHQFDAYYGVDSGTNDRPVADPLGAGETSYDVIADSVRRLAADLTEETGESVLPHQVQAVIWETWRELKNAHSGGWNTRNPFRLRRDGRENPVFQALQGEGLAELPASLYGGSTDTLPVAVLGDGIEGLEAITTPGQGVVYATKLTPDTDLLARHLYPAVAGTDRVPRWAQARAQMVDDAQKLHAVVGADPFTHAETYNSRALAAAIGDYPGLGSHEVVLFDVPTSFRAPRFLGGKGKIVDLGGAEVDSVLHDHTAITREDLIDEGSVREHLENNAWALIVGDERVSHAARAAGFDPITVTGPAGAGVLVFGPAEDVAARWTKSGRVITNAGERPQRALREIDERAVSEMHRRLGEDGGFTYNPQSGEFPTTGTVVGESGYELEVPVSEFTEETLDEFIDSASRVLGRNGAHIGGWHDTDRGLYVLDVTNVVDEGADVLGMMDRQRQRAAFDLGSGTEIQNPKFNADDPVPPPETWSVRSFDGKDVSFDPTQLATGRPGVARRSQRVSRMAYVIDRDRSEFMPQIVEDLERRGATNVVAHTPRTTLPGFSRAREHVFTDGISTRVYRTRTGAIGDPNAVPVWVRNNSNLGGDLAVLPPTVERINDRVIAGGSVRIHGAEGLSEPAWTVDPVAWTMTADPAGAVTKTGKRWSVPAEADALDAVRQTEVLRAAGVPAEDISIVTPDGSFGLQKRIDPSIERTPTMTTKFGTDGIRFSTRNLQPTDRISGGVRISPDFMLWDPSAGKMLHRTLDPGLRASVDEALDLFMSRHAEAAEVWRLPGIFVDGTDDRALAQVVWEPGSGVQLTKGWWSDPARLHVQTQHLVETGSMVSVPNRATGIVMHELGHVLHGATILAGGWQKNSPVDRSLRQLVKRVGGWGTVGDQISLRATVEPSELVAESVTDVFLSPHPSKLSRQVYESVTGQFEDLHRYTGLLWRSA